jgi:iron complex transport system substrate-binding protein
MTTRVLFRRLPALVAAVALPAAAAGCGSSAAKPTQHSNGAAASGTFPVTVTAANGAVRIAKRPTAIISLAPTATEMLYALGAGSQVTAVDRYSNYPASAPRTNLSGLTPNIEAIVARKPDLVVVSNYAANLTKRLAAFGIPVLSLPAPANVTGVYSEFDELGAATGHEQQAKAEVSKLRQEIAAIVAQVPHQSKPLTYYYELDQTYYSVTSVTFIGRLLGLLGMKSIADSAKGAAASGGYPQLSAEFIVKANPDYIILADTICCHQDASTVASRPGWASMAAVKDKHIILLNDNIASRWGPRIVNLLATVAAGIQGSK